MATDPALAKTLTYSRPPLYPKQEAAIFAPGRYSVVEASVKSGKTVGCIAWLYEHAIQGKPGQNFWWIAPVKAQANIPFRRLKDGLPLALRTPNETYRNIKLLPFNTTIWFKSADEPDTLYGEDVYAAVIDEATRCKEEAWHAVRSTLTATEGPIRIIGNVKGRKNWAYQLARKAEAGEPNWHYAKITAYDAIEAGVLSRDEVEDARRTFPDAVFRELYLAEPSDDEGNPFGVSAIRACLSDSLSAGPPVAWGWDLAKAVDYTVGVALDADGAVCRFVRYQKPWGETIDDIVAQTQAPALVDASGVGDPIVEAIQRRNPAVRFEGFKFSSQSKQALMEGLAVAIQQQQIHYPAGTIVNELESFEYVYSRTGVKYSCAEGLHDDCVCALALAVQQWRQAQAWTLHVWGAEPEVAQTEDEKAAADFVRVKEAEQAVLDELAAGGGAWFHGR